MTAGIRDPHITVRLAVTASQLRDAAAATPGFHVHGTHNEGYATFLAVRPLPADVVLALTTDIEHIDPDLHAAGALTAATTQIRDCVQALLAQARAAANVIPDLRVQLTDEFPDHVPGPTKEHTPVQIPDRPEFRFEIILGTDGRDSWNLTVRGPEGSRHATITYEQASQLAEHLDAATATAATTTAFAQAQTILRDGRIAGLTRLERTANRIPALEQLLDDLADL